MKKRLFLLIKVITIATIIFFTIFINYWFNFFPSTEGKRCGGLLGIRCSFGLKCDYIFNGPDSPGICEKPSKIGKNSKEKVNNNPQTCTMEAKICPDGSSVGRTGPNCEFSPCPETGSN